MAVLICRWIVRFATRMLATDNGSPVFHPLLQLDDFDLADLLRVIRVTSQIVTWMSSKYLLIWYQLGLQTRNLVDHPLGRS